MSDPLRLPLCDSVQLLVREDESLEILFRTEADNQKITAPVTNKLLLSLHSILKMKFDTSDWPQD
jgi:hypothetical protein